MSDPNALTWYFARNGDRRGPFTWADLQHQAAGGGIEPGDLVWGEGMADWTPAAQLPGLLPAGPLSYSTPMLEYRPPDATPYAGFWRRFAAVAIDGLLLWCVNFVVGFAIGFTLAVATGHRQDLIAQGLATVCGGVINWVYEAIMISSERQATLGKMAMGIIVVGPDGRRLGFGRSTGRYFAKILSAITLMIGYLMMLWTQRKQTLHDIVAGTYVLNRPR